MKNISEKHVRDTGLAVSFIILVICYFKNSLNLLPVTIALLALCLFFPYLLRLLLAPVLGLILKVIGPLLSRIFLVTSFYGIITPVGILRRISGVDHLQLKKWKKGNLSVFKVREQTIERKDLEKPF